MIGLRKEVNREENLEIIPYADGTGTFYLYFEAWVGDPIVIASWKIPDSAVDQNRNMPEPGDIIRARWEAVNATDLRVRASYYDASQAIWFDDIIDHTFRRFKLGSSTTYPVSNQVAAPIRNYITTALPTLTWSRISWASGYEVEVAKDLRFTQKVFIDSSLPATSVSVTVNPPLIAKGIYYWRVRAFNSNNWSQVQTFQYH